jgi:hypothetical protein
MLMAPAMAGPASADDAATAPAAATEPSRDDYYTRRAKTLLESERRNAAQGHPLAASYPGMDIVVCEAGCPTHSAPEIVYARPQPAPATAAREGVMVPTSATDGAGVSSDDGISCVAGCYDQSANSQLLSDPVIGQWSTGVDHEVEGHDSAEVKAPETSRAARDPLSPIR